MAEDCEGQVVPGRVYGRKTPRPLKVEEGHRYKASAAVDKLAEEKLPRFCSELAPIHGMDEDVSVPSYLRTQVPGNLPTGNSGRFA